MRLVRFNAGNLPGVKPVSTAERQEARDIAEDMALGSVDPDFESFGLSHSRSVNIGRDLIINLGGNAPVAAFRRRMW
jgi:hypothetical protein